MGVKGAIFAGVGEQRMMTFAKELLVFVTPGWMIAPRQAGKAACVLNDKKKLWDDWQKKYAFYFLLQLLAVAKCTPVLQGPDLQPYNRCSSLALHQPGVQTYARWWIHCLFPASTFASQSDLSQERGKSSPGNSGTELGLVCLEGNMDATDWSCLALQMQTQRQYGSMTHIRSPWICSRSKQLPQGQADPHRTLLLPFLPENSWVFCAALFVKCGSNAPSLALVITRVSPVYVHVPWV